MSTCTHSSVLGELPPKDQSAETVQQIDRRIEKTVKTGAKGNPVNQDVCSFQLREQTFENEGEAPETPRVVNKSDVDLEVELEEKAWSIVMNRKKSRKRCK